MTHDEQAAPSLFAELRHAAPAVGTGAAMPVVDPNAGWIVCEGVAGFASLQEGVRHARAAMQRGEHDAMQPVPEPVGEFIKDWMARRYAISQARAQTVFVLDDASRIWASRLITYLSQLPEANSQRLHFIHRAIAGATVSLAQVRLEGGAQADSQIYWADARGRGHTSHEVRDAFSANGDVLTVLVGPMSANAFDKVSGMLRAQWELRRGSLRRVVLLVTSHSPPPRQAVDALLEDFAGAARAAYVNLSDAGQCWNAMQVAAQDLPVRPYGGAAAAAPDQTALSATRPTAAVSTLPLTPTAAEMRQPASTTAFDAGTDVATDAAAENEGPALDVLDLYAASEGLRSVALFNHLGELVLQREGTSWQDSRQVSLFESSDPVALGQAAPRPPTSGDSHSDGLRRSRQGQALRAVLAAAGLQPPKHMLMEGENSIDIVEPVLGMPTLWLWSHFSARHVAPVRAQVLSGRLAADLAQVLAGEEDPWRLLAQRQWPAHPDQDTL
jgi:hypothetical protein